MLLNMRQNCVPLLGKIETSEQILEPHAGILIAEKNLACRTLLACDLGRIQCWLDWP